MNKPPPLDAPTAAIAMALCDLILIERARFDAVLVLLQRKGLLTADDLSEVNRATAELRPHKPKGPWRKLQALLQERSALHFELINRQFEKGEGPVQ